MSLTLFREGFLSNRNPPPPVQIHVHRRASPINRGGGHVGEDCLVADGGALAAPGGHSTGNGLPWAHRDRALSYSACSSAIVIWCSFAMRGCRE